MVSANPFRGLRFDPAVVGDPGRIVAPPYDVISPEARAAYEASSPYNMVRLILAQNADPHAGGEADYSGVSKLLSSWVDEGALTLDPNPALYAYEQSYDLGGRRRVQRGVLASVRLDPARTEILPHERTMAAPVADRLKLLESTAANLSPVFGLYTGRGSTAGMLAEMMSGPPALECVDEVGMGHRLWVVSDPGLISAWQAELAGRQLLIADGHHRYRTSLAYREAERDARPGAPDGPWDEILMLVADADADGPSVLPIHRLLAGQDAGGLVTALADVFEAREVAGPAEAEAALAAASAEVSAFGLYGGGRTWVLTATDQQRLDDEVGAGRPAVDVEVLHGPVLGHRAGITDFEHAVVYEADRERATGLVDKGDFGALVLLRPVRVSAVLDVAKAGGTLPQKTTFFYPKPRDGMVMRPFTPEQFETAALHP
jgi:uncharacterized protein (DUF1015 family)